MSEKDFSTFVEKATDDKFRSNSSNFFGNMHKMNDASYSKGPLKDLEDYSRKQQLENLKKRVLKNIALLPIYTVAAYMSITNEDDGNFVPDVLYLALALITSIAESREKRNFATIGHAVDCIGKAIVSIQHSLVKNLNLTEDKKNEAKILSQGSPLKKVATFLRAISYFSGFALILCKFGYEVLHKDEVIENNEAQDKSDKKSDADIKVLFNLMSVAMPLVNTLIWYLAASVRLDNFKKLIENYIDCSTIIASKSSYPDEMVQCEKIKKKFEEYKDQNCQNEGFFKADHYTNPGKLIVMPSWFFSSIIRNVVPSLGFGTQDLTKQKPGSSLTNSRGLGITKGVASKDLFQRV
jgi:hypothetical protein